MPQWNLCQQNNANDHRDPVAPSLLLQSTLCSYCASGGFKLGTRSAGLCVKSSLFYLALKVDHKNVGSSLETPDSISLFFPPGRRNGWRAASTRISDWSSEQHPSASRRTITISSKLITEQRCNAILSSFLDCWFWNHHHHHHGPFKNTFPPCPSCSIDLPPVPYWHSVSVPSLCIAVPYCPGFYIHFVHLTPGWLHTLYHLGKSP